MDGWEIINYALALLAIVLLMAVAWISLGKDVTDEDLSLSGSLFCFAAMASAVFIFSVFTLMIRQGMGW